MSYFQLTSKLAGTSSPEVENDVIAARLFVMRLSELEFCLTGIALTGSIVNCVALNRKIQRQYSVATFLPPEPKLWSQSFLTMMRDAFSHEVIHDLFNLQSTLAQATRLTSSAHSLSFQSGHAHEIDWFEVSGSWRDTARAARKAYRSTLLLAKNDDQSGFDPILDALRGVEAGEAPLVTAAGEVAVPAIAERRKTARIEIGKIAQLYVGSSKNKIVLRDISTSGMGLSDCPVLELGTKVAVELQNGRILSGIVVWSRNGRTGVRFSEVLAHNDTIFLL